MSDSPLDPPHDHMPEVVFSAPVFDVVHAPTPDIPGFTYVRHPGAVCVLPYNHASVFLTKQFRPAVGETAIEPVAGTMEENEHILMTAVRELEEELGYQATQWTYLCRFSSSPGYTSEIVHLFAATGLDRVRNPRTADDTDRIEELILRNTDIEGFLTDRNRRRQDETGDLPAKTLIALMWYLRFIKEES